jgi:hypothetical protein
MRLHVGIIKVYLTGLSSEGWLPFRVLDLAKIGEFRVLTFYYNGVKGNSSKFMSKNGD